jgi:hypothetical protein
MSSYRAVHAEYADPPVLINLMNWDKFFQFRSRATSTFLHALAGESEMGQCTAGDHTR